MGNFIFRAVVNKLNEKVFAERMLSLIVKMYATFGETEKNHDSYRHLIF